MGRAGGGSRPGVRAGGGHSAGSRVGGGHYVGSSRAGAGSTGRAGSSRAGAGHPGANFRGGGHMPPPLPPRRGFAPPPTGGYYGGPVYRRRGSAVSTLVWIIILLIILAVVNLAGRGQVVSSTVNREKLESDGFTNDCIVDELGWFNNVSATERSLQNFYNKTGVQPYIVLHKYDKSLTTEEEKEAWAQEYYEDNIANEYTFLYVYFAEKNTDEDIGYMYYLNGREVSSVMDSEAVEIFWNNIDKYWYTDMSTDDLFVTVFDKTADTIMRVSTTFADVAKRAVTGGIIVIVIVLLFVWWRQKARRAKEKAAETERILNTPMQDLVNDEAEKLAKKYDQIP